ncbi:hypothetical protein D9613_000421 [Agrocybe pediades]|uniref:General transcription and DNA repair factor IIH subunit TFB4 n=1 Tax=Agrocybe pediades TaxID=84607 RepID=A0A8H4VSV1_9AGAR|nr:hypothetical protein D9613_000421 [Agrocybe pediades]
MDCSHLSVVLDLSPAHWQICAQHPQSPLDLSDFLSQLLAFLNAHIALKHENSLAVFAAFPGKRSIVPTLRPYACSHPVSHSVMLYSSTDPPGDHPPQVDPNSYPPFKLLDSAVLSRIHDELDDSEEPSALVGALTKALCYINRLSLGQNTDPRILILSVSPDLSTSYIPIMNSIFSAQKLKITVDACQIFGPDTVFLQQAAHLTGGAYLYLERREALLQYLIMAFLPSPSIRKVLAVPTQDKIDFRAACFCHKNIVDIGYVCSVCLSIFCQPLPVCSTCRTKFPIKTIMRLRSSLPPSDLASAAPSPPTMPLQTRPSQNGTQNGSKH